MRDVAATGNDYLDLFAATLLLIIKCQPLPQLSCGLTHNIVIARIVISGTSEDVNANLLLRNFFSPPPQKSFNYILEE